MSSLVAFDQKGAFGPAMTLIYNSQDYNETGILDLSNLLKSNFLKLSTIKAKGRKEFCTFILKKNQMGASIAPIEVINTRFFKSMKKSETSALYHEKF